MAPERSNGPKAERIEEVVHHAQERLSGRDSAAAERFIRQYYDRVPPEDILDSPADSLYASAFALWKFGERREPGTAKVRVLNPTIDEQGWTSTRTVVEAVQEDMPFLLDSMLAELGERAHGVHLIIHPALRVRRGDTGKCLELAQRGDAADGFVSESWMHFEIDALADDGTADLEARIVRVLADVRAAVDDWRPVLAKLDDAISELAGQRDAVDESELGEAQAFLEWIRDNHFTFLGYRAYTFHKGGKGAPFRMVDGSGLGILRDPEVHVLTGARSSGGKQIGFLDSVAAPIMITKTSRRSNVHRPGHMDYIGVKRFAKDGSLAGEHRFIGLFTSGAYNRSPRDIPLLRRKVIRTVEGAGFSAVGHDGKALINILETFPRDELFQVSEEELSEFSLGILDLLERPRIKLFARREQFGRYTSCLVFVPREIHSTALRKRYEAILEKAFAGTITVHSTEIGDSPLARIHLIVQHGDSDGDAAAPDVGEIEAKLVAAARTWNDDLLDVVTGGWGAENGKRLFATYSTAFTGGYRETFTAREARVDIEKIEAMTAEGALALNMYRPIEAPDHTLRFKIYHAGEPLALSDCLPMLENLGLKVLEERPYEIDRGDGAVNVWLHDLLLVDANEKSLDLAAIKDRFQEAFARLWSGEVENDGFNRLVLRAGLMWREVVILRAYAKYLRQAGVAFSQSYIEETLAANPEIAASLVALFRARFDPQAEARREALTTEIGVAIETALDAVANLDQDRILRRYLNLVQATLRTNYFQPAAGANRNDDPFVGKPYVSFKIDSATVDELPLPRPLAEIFVYSPRVEAVHLRGGIVARGGLRWSDRREDFRTEVLGLMKAQMVKNAVIVPVGSKGGFVTKRLPTQGGRETVMEEVVACYTTMQQGMLDITDNYQGVTVVPPSEVMRHDGDDPYLVVAADKGTATFSDIANGIAESYGFWLGDAYASGGSAGYDHKKMGITARGAWESVKRHFRELGVDTQTQDFTVVGVGDMGGDVFGNGMLLSKHTRLVAAFNHMNIFLDPDPDPAASFVERKRLYETPRTTWADYEAGLISQGGGVFDRGAKSIGLSPEVQALIGVESASLTPAALIRALLMAEVDLLWLGGIGTYVKASTETDADAGDRASDALRSDATELRCRVVGEGANLGFTQRGRIEYALAGGRINTDAVDNAAGVNTSDREVNIKILLGGEVSDGEMTRKQRDRLLAQMTDEVAALVLRDNYLQTQAISLAEANGAALVDPLARLMRGLERAGRLDRELEFLPDDEAIAERTMEGQCFSRPEISVILSYAKMTLFEALCECDVPEDPYLEIDLVRYFPEPLRLDFLSAIKEHRLRREIIATHVANNVVNRAGITFIGDIAEETGLPAGDITRAYLVSREAFGMRKLWKAVEAFDNRVAAQVQHDMILRLMELVRQATLWFVRNGPKPLDIADTIDGFGPGIAELWDNLTALQTDQARAQIAETAAALGEAGVPAELAERIGGADLMGAACHIVHAARQIGRPVTDVGATYFGLGARLGLDWLRQAARELQPKDHWETVAITAIVEDLYGQQRALTGRVFDGANGGAGDEAIDLWVDQHLVAVERTQSLIGEFKSAGGVDVARLAIANRQVRSMILD